MTSPPKAVGLQPHENLPLKDREAFEDFMAHNASKDGSDIQANDKGPSNLNSTEQMNQKIEQMMKALEAWARILQQELNSGSEAGDGALPMNVDISFIATIAVRSDKDGKGGCLVKLACDKDYPHMTKPSVETLPESHKKLKKEAMNPSKENWSMVDVLNDIKKVMED